MRVYKIQSNGNDFCLIKHTNILDYSTLAKKICNRNFGVGGMGLIIVKENPLEFILFDANGKKVSINYDALACFSYFVFNQGISRNSNIKILTGIGNIELEIDSEIPFSCRLNLGLPNLKNTMLYVSDPLDCFGRILRINESSITSYSVSFGQTHTVIIVDSFSSNSLELAKDIANYKIFARGTTVDFVIVHDKRTIEVKTYDKNEGFIPFSGVGVVSAHYVVNKLKLAYSKVECKTNLGSVYIEQNRKQEELLSFPAMEVFDCEFKGE